MNSRAILLTVFLEIDGNILLTVFLEIDGKHNSLRSPFMGGHVLL